jgi:hypothetical protein
MLILLLSEFRGGKLHCSSAAFSLSDCFRPTAVDPDPNWAAELRRSRSRSQSTADCMLVLAVLLLCFKYPDRSCWLLAAGWREARLAAGAVAVRRAGRAPCRAMNTSGASLQPGETVEAAGSRGRRGVSRWRQGERRPPPRDVPSCNYRHAISAHPAETCARALGRRGGPATFQGEGRGRHAQAGAGSEADSGAETGSVSQRPHPCRRGPAGELPCGGREPDQTTGLREQPQGQGGQSYCRHKKPAGR